MNCLMVEFAVQVRRSSIYEDAKQTLWRMKVNDYVIITAAKGGIAITNWLNYHY